VAIGDTQVRIGEINALLMQARLGYTGTLKAAGATPAASGPNAVAATGTATATSGAAFAKVLDSALVQGAPDSQWISPLPGEVTSEYGPRWGTQHKGIDIAAASGTPVRAAGGGTVTTAGWSDGYGNLVIVDHGDGTTTRYAHNSSLDVKAGDRVAAGQVISRVGSTGDSTGPHLHFEVRVNGEATNPRLWLRQRGIEL
jgi:murein DD-endopeptidase MepM/ murein hydrolase activator NlpD